DPRLAELLATRWLGPSGAADFEEAAQRVKDGGMLRTIQLVNRLGFRASARLECLEDSEEKEALRTLVEGIACLPLVEGLNQAELVDDSASCPMGGKRLEIKVDNLRLRAELQRLRSSERRSKDRLRFVREVASGRSEPGSAASGQFPLGGLLGGAKPQPRRPVGLGLEFDAKEIEWLLLRGLERRVSVPDSVDLESLLSCVAPGMAEVQRRLLGLSDVAQSLKLKGAVHE
ncbi:unnamed protein product, partial [Polarella glacialis]